MRIVANLTAANAEGLYRSHAQMSVLRYADQDLDAFGARDEAVVHAVDGAT